MNQANFYFAARPSDVDVLGCFAAPSAKHERQAVAGGLIYVVYIS